MLGYVEVTIQRMYQDMWVTEQDKCCDNPKKHKLSSGLVKLQQRIYRATVEECIYALMVQIT